MARTKHQIVQKVAVGGAAYHAGKKRGAKNANLKQAAHQGRAAVANPKTAQPGFTAVPTSTATLPPGEGPPMSSAQPPAKRGGRSSGASVKKQATASLAARASGARKRRGSRAS